MHIFDNENKKQEVTDLDAAIRQADFFRYAYDPQQPELSLNRWAYWQDIYDQLIALQQAAKPDKDDLL